MKATVGRQECEELVVEVGGGKGRDIAAGSSWEP